MEAASSFLLKLISAGGRALFPSAAMCKVFCKLPIGYVHFVSLYMDRSMWASPWYGLIWPISQDRPDEGQSAHGSRPGYVPGPDMAKYPD